MAENGLVGIVIVCLPIINPLRITEDDLIGKYTWYDTHDSHIGTDHYIVQKDRYYLMPEEIGQVVIGNGEDDAETQHNSKNFFHKADMMDLSKLRGS